MHLADVNEANTAEAPLAHAGSAGDLAALYHDGYHRFLRVAEAITRDPEEARDAVQEGFSNALRELDRYAGRGSFEGWVWRCVVNAARMARRKSRFRPLAWDDVLARVTKHPRPRRRLRASRRALAGAMVAAAGLSVGGFALADAVEHGPLHGGRIDVDAATLPGGISSCELIGKPAGQVSARLASSGIGIEWRFTHWGTTVASTALTSPAVAAQAYAHAVAQAEAVTGGSSDAVSSVPDDSVVWDVVPDGQTKAFVFVEAPNDPNAPQIDCPG